jgi:hypothetical protein
MINLAARATNGVKIPSQKEMRSEIRQMSKNHPTALKARVNVRKDLDDGESSETAEKDWDDLLIDDEDEDPLAMETDIG